MILLYEPKKFNVQIDNNGTIAYRISIQNKQYKRSTGIKEGDYKYYNELNTFLKKLDDLKHLNKIEELEKIVFSKKKKPETKTDSKTIREIYNLALTQFLKPTSKANINKYKNAVDKFDKFFPNFPIIKIDRKIVKRFIYKCIDSKLSYYTVTGYKTMLTTLLQFAEEEGFIKTIPKLKCQVNLSLNI